MIRARCDANLTGVPLDRATPFSLYRFGLNYSQLLTNSKVFGDSSGSNFKGYSCSHSWKQISFRHVGSIFGRQPESNIKLIVNN
jgi:hypothetical protein